MTPAEQELAQWKTDREKFVQDQAVKWARQNEFSFAPYEDFKQFIPDRLDTWYAEYDKGKARDAFINNTPLFQEYLRKFQNNEILQNVGVAQNEKQNPYATSRVSPELELERFLYSYGVVPGGDRSAITRDTIVPIYNEALRAQQASGGGNWLDKIMGAIPQIGFSALMGNALGASALFGGDGGATSVLGQNVAAVPSATAGAGVAYPSMTDAAINTAVSGTGAGATGAAVPSMLGSSITGASLANAGLGAASGLASYLNPASMSTASPDISNISGMFDSGYPSMTDSAVDTASGFGGTGATGSAIPSMYAPSMTEAALGTAGIGAAGASSLYPSLTNLASSTGGIGGSTSEGSWLDTAKSALGGGNTLSSLISGGSALWGANQTANAAKEAAAEAKRQFDIGQANAAPWLNAGKTALGSQLDLLGLPGGTGNSESSLAQLQKTPGYQFRLNQGRKNLEASSAARGGMGSGKSGVAMQNYGQNYATNEYNNRLNQLASLSGSGQTQANTSAYAGQQYGTEAGNAALTAATARQSGILGAGSALSDWLNPKPKTPTLADLLKGVNYGY